MTAAKKYLEILKEREPQLWEAPLKESGFTEKDLSDIEKGLGYKLPIPYREFLLSYEMPNDITVLVSFCGDSFACSWSKTFSRENNGYISRPEFDIGPTVEFEWHNIQGHSGVEFLKNLQQEQKTQDYCTCFFFRLEVMAEWLVKMVEKRKRKNHSRLQKTTMLMLAVTLHNLPEGTAVGVVYAGWLSGEARITAMGALSL